MGNLWQISLPIHRLRRRRRTEKFLVSEMSKYGLNLRVPQQKKAPTRPPLPRPRAFCDDDDDDDVEKEIARQAIKSRAHKEIEEQHKKALEEDPSAFDYDGVYDEMKQKSVLPRVRDREEKKPKYIIDLMKKAEERQREHEIIYERKLVKERSKEDHLYADKEKFVTSAYKKKLAEEAKWKEEELRRQLQEEKDDVTKKTDIMDFYFNLQKNVAFGGNKLKTEKQTELTNPEKQPEIERRPPKDEAKVAAGSSDKSPSTSRERSQYLNAAKEGHEGETSMHPKRNSESEENPVSNTAPVAGKDLAAQPPTDEPKRDHHKRTEDALAAAKERFLARKKAKQE